MNKNAIIGVVVVALLGGVGYLYWDDIAPLVGLAPEAEAPARTDTAPVRPKPKVLTAEEYQGKLGEIFTAIAEREGKFLYGGALNGYEGEIKALTVTYPEAAKRKNINLTGTLAWARNDDWSGVDWRAELKGDPLGEIIMASGGDEGQLQLAEGKKNLQNRPVTERLWFELTRPLWLLPVSHYGFKVTKAEAVEDQEGVVRLTLTPEELPGSGFFATREMTLELRGPEFELVSYGLKMYVDGEVVQHTVKWEKIGGAPAEGGDSEASGGGAEPEEGEAKEGEAAAGEEGGAAEGGTEGAAADAGNEGGAADAGNEGGADKGGDVTYKITVNDQEFSIKGDRSGEGMELAAGESGSSYQFTYTDGKLSGLTVESDKDGVKYHLELAGVKPLTAPLDEKRSSIGESFKDPGNAAEWTNKTLDWKFPKDVPVPEGEEVAAEGEGGDTGAQANAANAEGDDENANKPEGGDANKPEDEGEEVKADEDADRPAERATANNRRREEPAAEDEGDDAEADQPKPQRQQRQDREQPARTATAAPARQATTSAGATASTIRAARPASSAYTLGMKAYREGRGLEAERQLLRAPQTSTSCRVLGEIYYGRGDYSRAHSYLSRTAQLAPQSWEAERARQLLHRMGYPY
ncbi:MAG TPA: tetratricopeptide repeat protein [bacterium]|nr:tetratricopeptide repeat protein [bacterium]